MKKIALLKGHIGFNFKGKITRNHLKQFLDELLGKWKSVGIFNLVVMMDCNFFFLNISLLGLSISLPVSNC